MKKKKQEIIIHDVVQGSEEWFACRRGKFTASNFSDLFMGKTTKTYNNLISQVVFERLTGETPESFSNEWMDRGIQLEAEAIERYESETFCKVKRVGFVELNEWVGGSPDGFVKDGLIEVKCPKFSTLIDYILSGEIPSDYMYQMQGEMMVTGRPWCDFFAYHPKMKPLIRRVPRDEAMIEAITKELAKAIETAQQRLEKIGGVLEHRTSSKQA